MQSTSPQRHLNFRILQGRTPFKGSPKSDHIVELLKQHGLNVSPKQVSAIYWGESEIEDHMARKIESAFALPAGWLDSSHEYAFHTRVEDRADIEALLSLSAPVRQVVGALLHHLIDASSAGAKGNG
jgi:hypothetical protein